MSTNLLAARLARRLMLRCADPSCARRCRDLSALAWAGRVVRRWSAIRFNDEWYCSRACVEQAAWRGLAQSAAISWSPTPRRPLKLGVLLQDAGTISRAQLERDVSYLSAFDVSRVRRAPVALPEAMVRSLGLVPFEADFEIRQVRVICAAPLQPGALRAFARLTGWTPEAYLVTDRVFEAALAAYRPADDAESLHGASTVGNIGAAAAHVADAAVVDRTVTMRHAAFDNRLWVRIEGMRRVSDLIVTNQRREGSRPVELTAH